MTLVLLFTVSLHCAAQGELEKQKASIGVIVAGAAIEVSAQRAGKIAAIYVKPGQKVSANELLFALQRDAVDNDIAVSTAALEQAQAGDIAARTALEKAQSEAARQAQAPALFTNAQRDAMRFEVQTRAAQLRAARANVAELAARASQSRAVLDQVVVRATSASTVAAILRTPGEMANAGDTVLRLERRSTPRVRFALNTDRARQLRVDDVVRVQDSRGQYALAKVLMIAPDIDAPTGMVIAEAQWHPYTERSETLGARWQCRLAQGAPVFHACGWQTGTAVDVLLGADDSSTEVQQ